MSVCPRCGAFIEKSIAICTNCGADCGANPNIPGQVQSTDSPATTTDRPKAAETNWAATNAPRGGDSLSYQKENNESDPFSRLDSQLGKGTITPQTVERGIDGYHFKYDEPSRAVTKVEPAKEKTIEYRVTDLDLNPPKETESLLKWAQGPVKTSIEKSSADNTSLETVTEVEKEALFVGPAAETLPEASNDKPETVINGKPVTSGGFHSTEVSHEVIAEMQDAEPEMAKVFSEPAFLDDAERPVNKPAAENVPVTSQPICRVIWKGKSHIWGIPFGPFYQITDQSIRITGPRGVRAEYPLNQIARLQVKQNWLGRLCGNGDLIIGVRETMGEINLSLKGIPNPQKIRQLIADLNGSGYNIKYG